MKKLKYGIVGCGLIADWHLNSVRVIEKDLPVELYAVTDSNPARAKEYALKHGLVAFDTLDELLNTDVDIISICTPSGTHAQIAVEAANHKKHIVVEKPMAITEEQLDSVVEACDRNNVKLGSISQMRYYNSVKKTREAVQNGTLGRMVSGDVYMKHFRSQEYYDKGGWRGTKAMDGGGALMNQGIHGIDILQYIMGPIKTVYAKAKTLARKIEVEDTLAAVVEYENGALGVVQATTSVFPGYSKRFSFHGDKGSVRLEESCMTEWTVDGVGLPEDLQLEKAEHSSASTPNSIKPDGHIAQIRDLVECVLYDKKPLIDCREGRRAVDVILAIYASAETGKEINIKEFTAHRPI